MKIKDIDLGKHPILLAPMEDVTDPAFRLMCKGFGAGYGVHRVCVERRADTFRQQDRTEAEHQ